MYHTGFFAQIWSPDCCCYPCFAAMNTCLPCLKEPASDREHFAIWNSVNHDAHPGKDVTLPLYCCICELYKVHVNHVYLTYVWWPFFSTEQLFDIHSNIVTLCSVLGNIVCVCVRAHARACVRACVCLCEHARGWGVLVPVFSEICEEYSGVTFRV